MPDLCLRRESGWAESGVKWDRKDFSAQEEWIYRRDRRPRIVNNKVVINIDRRDQRMASISTPIMRSPDLVSRIWQGDCAGRSGWPGGTGRSRAEARSGDRK